MDLHLGATDAEGTVDNLVALGPALVTGDDAVDARRRHGVEVNEHSGRRGRFATGRIEQHRPRRPRRHHEVGRGKHPGQRRTRRDAAGRGDAVDLGPGHLLGDRDLDNNFALFVVAGNETTRQSMALGLLALLRDDRAMQEFSQPGATTDQAVDELVRIASPVWHFRRTAVEDTEIRGVEIKEGERVVIWFAAANRDAEAFADPHVLDFSRKKDEHLAFGRGGPHYCIGTHLARLEIKVLYEQLFPRLKSIEQTGPERRLVSNFTNGLKHFPVRITAN